MKRFYVTMAYQRFWYAHECMLLKQFTIKCIYFYISAFPLRTWDENANVRRFKYNFGQSNLSTLYRRIPKAFGGMSSVV
jgi:hypothetical protein